MMFRPDTQVVRGGEVADAEPADVDFSTARVEAFSDGVLAIAITLLVLNLQVEASDDLAGTLARMWPSYVAYVVTFLIIGVVWMNHHLMFHYIRRTDRVLLVLNLLLLMSVSFLPWPAKVLAEAMNSGHGKNVAAVLYGGTLVVGGIFFNAIWFYASHRHRHLGAHITPDQAARIRRQFAIGPFLYLFATVVGPFLYLFATVVGAFSAEAGLLLYGLLLVAYMFEAGASSRRTAARRRRALDAPPQDPSAGTT
jgi:uncharacterized membrane protein